MGSKGLSRYSKLEIWHRNADQIQRARNLQAHQAQPVSNLRWMPSAMPQLPQRLCRLDTFLSTIWTLQPSRTSHPGWNATRGMARIHLLRQIQTWTAGSAGRLEQQGNTSPCCRIFKASIPEVGKRSGPKSRRAASRHHEVTRALCVTSRAQSWDQRHYVEKHVVAAPVIEDTRNYARSID